ncbi:MAG: helicase C-terminal domain-containing protein [Acidobacteriota bacterium]
MPSGVASALDRVFADDGPLAQAVHEFEPRAGQREMANAVARAFIEGRILLAEAGTGTGKTLAYLVPAILCRQRVLVSTGTKNLQEQIFYKDLPLLERSLGMPFTAAYMKGRSNYLCLHRFAQLREDPDVGSPADRVYLRMVEDWALETATGDRAELEDLPEDVGFWSRIAATAEECLGTACPEYDDCFVTRMRRRAAESDLIVVNHHLLCADASVRRGAYGEVIPDCAFAVIDEAHQLEDVVTQHFGMSVSTFRVEDFVGDAERLLAGAGVVDDEGLVGRAINAVEDRARLFFAALAIARMAHQPGTQAFASGGSDDRVRVRPGMLDPAIEPGGNLVQAFDDVAAAIADLDEPPEDARAIAARAIAMRDELRFLLRTGDADYVYFLEWRGRGLFLRASPIEVSAIVRESLLDRFASTVLTSATLSVDGSFGYLRGRLGIGAAAEVRLPSEFDFRTQAILYLPASMPSPKQPEFGAAAAREIVAILERTLGRAFVLFTSYAMLRAVQPVVSAALDFPIFVQGTAPRSVLLHRFRTTPHAVLLATSSFWQGVDVAGEALSCVIVDRLPFASPADPIVSARLEAITERGGDGFADLQVPLAILTLLQGLGRLIRHRRDRGVLAILDPRVRTMAYGRRFLASLPPAPVTGDIEEIRRFFAS